MGARCSTIKPRGVIKPSRKVDLNSITPTQRNRGNRGRKGSKASSLDDETQIENLKNIDNIVGVMIKQRVTSAETPTDDNIKQGSMSHLNETNANTSRMTDISHMKRLLHYKKGPLIGKGAYGEVFECLSQNTGELLAVKSFKLYGDLSKVLSYVETLKKEITLLRSLSNPNIVKYYTIEVNEARDDNYATVDIVLEYVSGGSVRKLLDKFNKLEERVISTYTRQILEGLSYLHMKGILHRNMKGSNILIDTSGTIKLTDFGCSGRPDRFSEENPQENNKSPTLSKGPAYWSAPEVIMRKAQGKPADVWSVGCVVLEMLTGLPPWSNSVRNMDEFVKQITLGTPPPFPKDISENCRDFLYKTFKFKPEDRPSPLELLDHPFVREDMHDNSYMEAESIQTMQTSNTGMQVSNPTFNGKILDLLKMDGQQGDKKYMDLKTNNFLRKQSTGNVSVSHVNIGRVATNITTEMTSSLYLTKPTFENSKSPQTNTVTLDKDSNFMMNSQKKKRDTLKTLSEANQEEECSPLPQIRGGNKRHYFSGNQNGKAISVPKEDDPKLKEARRKQLEEEMNRDLQRISTGQLSEFAAIDENQEKEEENDIEPTSDIEDEKTGNYKKRAPPIPIKNSLFTAKGARGGVRREEVPERPAVSRKESMKREEMENKTDNNFLGVPANEGRLCSSDVEINSSNSNVNDHEQKRNTIDGEMANVLQAMSVDDLHKFIEEQSNQISEEEKKKHQERLRKQFEEQMEISLARVSSDKVQNNWDRDGQSETSEPGENRLAERYKKQFEEESSSQFIRLSNDNVKDMLKAEENLDIENLTGKKFEEDILGNSQGWEQNRDEGDDSGKFISPQMTESDGRSPEDQRRKRPSDFSNLPYKEALSASSKNENFDRLNDSESFEAEAEALKGRGVQIIEEVDHKLGIINEAEELKEDSSDEEISRSKPSSRQYD